MLTKIPISLVKWWADLSPEKKLPVYLLILTIVLGFVINFVYKERIQSDINRMLEIQQTLAIEREEKIYWRDKYYEQTDFFRSYMMKDKILTDSIKNIVDSLKQIK